MKKIISTLVVAAFGFALATSGVSAQTGADTATQNQTVKQARVKSVKALNDLRQTATKLRTAQGENRASLVRNKLQNAIDVMESHLESLDENENLSADQITKRRATIEEVRARLTDIRARILAAKTDAEVNDIAKRIRTEHRKTTKSTLGESASKLGRAIQVAEERSAMMKARINEMQNVSVNKAELNTMLAEADVKIRTAKTDLASIVSRVGTTDADPANVTTLRESLKGVQKNIKEAYHIFRAVIAKVGTAANSADVSQ
ncbi:MAG: hypothetical protein AAB407_02420 [Patescibacteria group bacterium]